MSKQFYLFKKPVRGGEDNIFLTLWDFLESWTSQNDWMAIFFIIFLGIVFEIILIKICTSFQKKPALPEKGSSDSQENEDSSLKSLTFDKWSIHSFSEERGPPQLFNIIIQSNIDFKRLPWPKSKNLKLTVISQGLSGIKMQKIDGQKRKPEEETGSKGFSAPESRVDDFSERTITSSLTSEENEGNVEKRVSPTDEIMCADTSESKYQERYFSESHMTSSIGTSSSLSPFHSEIQKNFLSHRECPENENKIQLSSKKLFLIMKANKKKSLMFSYDFNFSRMSGITTESEDVDVVPCPPAHLFLSRDQVRLLEENVKYQIPLKSNATLHSKTTLCSRSQESLIQNQHSVRMDISAQAQDFFPGQSAIQNQDFYETQFISQAQQFVNHQDLINSQTDKESRHFAPPQDLRRKSFSSNTQDPFQMQDMNRSQHVVKVPYSAETQDSTKGLNCDKNPIADVQYFVWSEDANKIKYSIQGQNTIFMNARFLVLTVGPNSVAKGVSQLNSIKPKGQKQITTSKLNQYSVYGSVSLSPANKRQKNRRKTLHSKSKFSLKVPSPKSKKTPTSSIFHIIVHHPLKRNKLGCKYNSKKKELHQSEELGSNAGHSIKNMHDNRISDAFHNATNTTISEPPDREKHSTLKVKTDTPRITGLSHSMVKQEKLPDEKEMWNAEYTEERCTFKKPQEHDSEEEEQAQPEAVSQLAQDFRFSLRRKQKPKYVTLQIGQGSSGRGRPQNKEQETQPQILSTQMTWGMSPCPTVDPFQVEKVKHSRDRLTGRETADPQNPPTVPERLPAGDIFTGTPECGIPFRESPTKTLEDRMVEQKEALKRASPAVAPRCFTIHMLPLLYSKRQTIRKKIPRTKSVLNPKCVNMKVKKLAILLMPDINRRGTPCHVKRLRGNLKILIKQMLSGKMMTDMFLNALYPHRSTSPHVRTHSRVNAENHNHTKLKQEQSQTEREEKCSDSVNKESDSGNTLEKAQLQDEVRGDKEAPPKAFLPDSCNLRLDAHPEEELKTEEERHHPITSAEAIMESVSSSVMDPSHAENMKKILTAQIDLKCTADSEIPPPTSEKSLIGDLSSQTREADVSNYGSDTRETSHCFAETRAEFPKDLPTTFPEAFNGHVPDFTRSKVKRKRLRFSHIDYTTRPKSIHMKTMKPSVSQLFNIIGHREKLESNFKTKFEKSNQANELVYEFLNALYSPMHSTLKVEANSFCHAQLKQELTDEGRSRYADVFDESSTFNNIEAKVQDGEEVEQNPLLAAAAQHGRQSSADACQGKETHLDKPDPALNCLTQELQHQACFTQTAMQSDIQTGPGKAEELQKTNKTGNAKIAPTGLKIPSPKAGKSLFDQHLNMTTECGLPSDGNPKKQLDSYSVGKNSELPKDFQVTFLMSSDSVEPFVSKSKRKKNTSRTARRQITVSHRTIRQKKPSISHMLNDSQSKGLPCNLKTKMKNPQQNKNVADALLDILHSKVSVFPNSKTSSRLSLEIDIQRITRLGHMQLMQEKPPNEGRGCCPDSIDESGLSNSGKNGKQEEREHEALPAPENSQDFIFRPYQENHDLVKSDEELKKPESIHNQVQPQIPILQTILDSSPCPILDHFQFGMVEHSARFSPPNSGEAKMDEIFSTRACAVPSEATHQKERASGIEKKEIVTLDCCLPVCFTSRRKRNFKQYLSMKTLGNSKHEILKAKKPSISYILNIKGGTGPNHKKKLGFNLTTKVKEANQSKKTADKMCPFMSVIHNINTYSDIGRGKNMLGEKSLSSEQVEQAISHEGDVLSDNAQGANLQGEEEEESEQGPLLKVVLQHSQHFVFCSGQREELDFHKSENKRSGNILFVTEQDVPQQMQLPDPVQTEKPERSHQIQNGTVCTASSQLPLIKSKESLIGEVLVDTMKCSDSRDGSHMKELYSCGKEEKGEFKKDHQATVLESLDVTTPYPPESKRQRKTFTCTTLKNKMSPKGLIMKARKTPILPIFNIPGNGCLKNLPSKILTSQIIDFLIHIKHFTVLEDLRIERKEGLVQKLPEVILQSLDLPTLALPTSKRYTLKHIHKKNKMSPKCVTFKTKKAPISQTFNIRKHGTLIHGRQFECSFKAMMKQGKPAAHIILNAIPFAMPISCDMKVHERMKVKTDMSWKMRFSHELREQERSSLDGERAWCVDSKDKRGSTSQSAKKVEVQGREAALQNSQHFSFNGHKGKEPHLVKSDLELKNSTRKKIPDSLPTAQKLQQQTIFTQNISRSISCSILNLLQLEKLPKRTKTQKGLNDTESSKILSPTPRKSISESLIVTTHSGSPFEEIPRKELPSSIPKGGIRLRKNFQVRTLESFDFSMPASPEFKGQGNTVQICKPKTGEARMASVLRTFNVTRSGALCHRQEQEHILENMTKEIPLVLSNISINTFLSSIPVSPVIKMHKKLKAKKSALRKNSITQLKQDEGKRLNTHSSNKWSTSNNTSESRWQNEKEKQGNEMLFEGCLQFLNGTGSGRDQKMPIAEQEVQQKTLVSANVLGSICSPLIPLQTKNLKKTIPPQKDKLQRNGGKIPHPKSRKATLGDLLVNETTFGGSPTRMLDVNSAVSLQPKEEKEDVKTRQYMADQNLTPTKSGSSVLGDPGNKSCRRKVGGHIAEKHEDLQKELPTMSKTPALYESKMQKRVLKFPERKNLTYFWSQKTPFPKAGKSETDLAQCDAVWVGNPRTKWESPVSEEKAWNENDLVITFFKPLDFSSFVSSDPKSQSYTSKFVSKKSIKSSKHVTLKARKPPILHLLHITGCLRRSHKKKKQHKFKNKMKDRQWNENVGEPLFHATEGAKIPPPELVTDKPSVNTTVRGTLYNTTLHKNLDLHITEEMAGLGENFATTYWGPLDFFFPVLSDCASQINTVQLPKKKIIPIRKCLTMKKHKRPISQILKINRQFTTKHRKKLRSNLKIKIKERQQGKTVAGTFPNAIHFTLNISGIKRQSRLETGTDRVSRFSSIQPMQMDLPVEGLVISSLPNVTGHSALSISKEQEQKIDIDKDKIVLNADLKLRHASMPVRLPIQMEHSPSTWDIYEECSEKRNAPNKAKVREKEEYEKQITFSTPPQYTQPFEFGANQEREPGPFKPEASLINTVRPRDITPQKTDVDLIDQKVKMKAVEGFNPEFVSFSRIYPLQIKKQKTNFKTANRQTIAKPKILIPTAGKSSADVHSVNTVECGASLQQREGMALEEQGSPALHDREQEPLASGTTWNPAYTYTLKYAKIRKPKARAKTADVKNSVHPKRAKLKEKKPLDSQMPQTTGYGTQSNKKESRCDINIKKKAFQQGTTLADLDLSTICDSGSILSQIKGFLEVKIEKNKQRKLIHIPQPRKLNKLPRRKLSSSQSTDKNVISTNIKILKQYIREQREKHQIILVDILSQGRDRLAISQQVKTKPDHVTVADLEREVHFDLSSWKGEVNCTTFDIPQIRTHAEIECLTAPRVKEGDVDMVDCSVSLPWGRAVPEKTDNSFSSEGQDMFLTELDDSQQICKKQELPKQGSISTTNRESTACPIVELLHLENTGEVAKKYMDSNRKNISHLLGREGLTETDISQGQKFLCINLEVQQNRSGVTPDHIPENIRDFVSCHNREPLLVEQSGNATREENVSTLIGLNVNPWRKEQFKLTDIPIKSNRQKMNFSEKVRANQLNSSNQNKEIILECISSRILHHLHFDQLKKEGSAKGRSSTVLGPVVGKSSKEAGTPVDQPPCSEGINLHIRGRKEHQQESMCKVLPTSISHSSWDILQIKSPWVKNALKAIDSPVDHTSNTEGKEQQPKYIHQTFIKFASHSSKKIFQSKMPCKKKASEEVINTVDYTPSAERIGSMITRKGEQQAKWTCEALPKPTSPSKTNPLQINTPVQQVKLDDTNMMHCEYLTSQAKEALKGIDDIAGYTQKNKKRQNLLSIEQKQKHPLIPYENFLGHMSYPQNDPWLLQHLMPQPKEPLSEAGNVSSRTKGLDLFSKDDPNTLCEYGLEQIVPSIPPKQMKKQNTTLPLESCSKTIKYLSVSFPKGKKSPDRAQVIDLISNGSSPKLRIRKRVQSCKAYQKKVPKEVCLPRMFLRPPPIFMPILPESKIQKGSVKQRVKKDTICSKRRTSKLKKSVFPNILDITDCGTPGNRPELQCNIKEETVNKKQRKDKPDLVVTNICEFIPALPHLKLNTQAVDGIIANNLRKTQPISQAKEKDGIKEVSMRGIMNLNLTSRGKESSHTLNREELPVQIKQESKVQMAKDKSGVQLTNSCSSLPSLLYPNLSLRLKVGKEKSGIPRSCLPPLKLQTSSNVRETSFVGSINRDSLSSVAEPEQHLPQKKEDNIVYVKDIKDFKCATFKGKKTPFKYILHGKGLQWNNKEQEKEMQEDESDVDVVQNEAHASIPSSPSLEWSPGIKEVHMRGRTRFCFPLTLEESRGAVETCEDPTRDTLSCIKEEKYMPQKEENQGEITLEDRRHPERIAWKAKQFPTAQELQLNTVEKEKKMQEDKQVGIQSKFCASISLPPYSAVGTRIKETAKQIKTSSSLLQPTFQGPSDIGKKGYKKPIYGDISNSVKKAKEHIMQEKDERRKMVKVIPSKKKKSLIAQEIQWDIKGQETKIQKFKCQSSVVLASTSTSMPDASPLKLDTEVKKAEYLTEATRYSLPERSQQKSSDAGKKEDTSSVGGDSTSNDVKTGQGYEPQKGENGRKIVHVKYKMYHNGTTPKAKMLPLPHVLDTPRGCGLQVREVQTNTKEKLGHKQERKSELDEALTRLSLPQFKLKKDREGKGEEQGITRPFLSRSRQKESSDADKLKYTVSPSNNSTRDSKRAKHMMQKEEDKIHVFEKDIMHHMCVALKAKKAPLFHVLKSKALQVEIKGEVKRGQESNKERILSEICPFVASLTHLEMDAIEEEGEPGIIRNYVLCLDLHQSLASGQTPPTKSIDSSVEKGKHLPQTEKDRVQNRTKVEKDFLEMTGLSPLQFQFPVSSGAGKIKYADSSQGISSGNAIIKVNQHMPFKEVQDRVKIEDGKSGIFPQITLRAEVSPVTQVLSRKKQHLNIQEQWKAVHRGQGKPEVVLRQTSASLPCPSPLKQDTRMNGEEDTVGGTQSYFPPLKSQDPSNPDKKAYTQSCDGHMLKDKDILKMDIEDNVLPIYMDLMAKELQLPQILKTKELQWKIREQKSKVQEDKNELVTNTKHICTSLLTLPYLKLDTPDREGNMISVTKLPVPQQQSKELPDAVKNADAEAIDGELSNKVKKLNEHVLQEEVEREKKVDVKSRVGPENTYLIAKTSPISRTCNLGDQQWRTEEQEGKVKEVPCEPCAPTLSPLHLNTNNRIKGKSMQTLTRSSVSPVHVQESADSEAVVYAGPTLRDILIHPQEGERHMPQDKEEDGVEIINLMFPKHQEKKIQERKDQPGVLLTQSPALSPSLPHIDLHKEILVDDEMLVLKRSVLQRIPNAGEAVHTEPISTDTMQDVVDKKQHVPQKEERHREKTVAVRGLTRTTDRTLKKSPPSHTLHRTELHLNIGRQEGEKHDRQNKPSSMALRKAYVSKPSPAFPKLDKGTQADREGLGVKTPCLFPLRLSALSDVEKVKNTEAAGAAVRRRKQYMSQKEKTYEVHMKIRMQHQEARISPISRIFNTKEFVLNIRNLKRKEHNREDEPRVVQTRTFLSIPSAPLPYLDSGSKTDKEAPGKTGSAYLQKNPQESLDIQEAAIRESVSGNRIIVKRAQCSVPQDEAVQQWTSNFMISVQQRNETPQVTSKGDLCQLIVNSQHEDIHFPGFDTLRPGKRLESFFTGLQAKPEKNKRETFTTLLSYPTMEPTKIENLKKETEIMGNFNHKTCPQTSVSLPKEISREIYATLGTPVSSKGFPVSEEDDHQTISKAPPTSADSCKYDKISKTFSSKVLVPQIKGSLKKMNIRKSNACHNTKEQEIVMKKQVVQWAEGGHKTALNSSLSLKFPLQNGKQKTPLEVGVHEQTAVYPGLQMIPRVHVGIRELDATRGGKEQVPLIPEQEECILESFQNSPSPCWTFPLQSGDLKEKNETDTSMTVNAKQKNLEMEDRKLKIDTSIAVHLKEDKIEMHKHTTVNLEKELVKMDTSNTVNLNALSLKAEKSQVKTQGVTDMANSYPIKQKRKKELAVPNAKQNIQPQKLFQKHILDSLYAYIPLSHKFEGWKGRLTIADLKRELCPKFLTMKIPKHPILQILDNTGHGTPIDRKKLEYDFNKPKNTTLWNEGASGIFIRSLSISVMSPSQTEKTIESEMSSKRGKRACLSKFQEKSPNASEIVKRNNSNTVKKGDQNFKNIVPEDSYLFVVDQQQMQKLSWVKSEANLNSEISKKNLTPHTEERVVSGHDIPKIIKEPDLFMIKQEETVPKPILTPPVGPLISEDPKENVETHVKSTLTMSIYPLGVEQQPETHLFVTMKCVLPPEHMDQSEPIQNTTTQKVQQQKAFPGTVPMPPQVKSNEIKIVVDNTNAASLLPLYEAIKNVFESWIKNMTQDKAYADRLEKVQGHKSDDWKSPPFAWGPDTTSTTICPQLQPKPIVKGFSPKLKNKLTNHLVLKALQIRLNLIPEMAQRSFQTFNFYPKLAISEDKSWRLYPRYKKMYFLSLEGIDTINLNVKHKHQKDSPHNSCMKTLTINVSSGSKEDTTKLKSIKKLESGTSAVAPANEMPLSHILQKYQVEEKDKLLIHFSVKTLEIQMKVFPRTVTESYAMANAQDRGKPLSKCIGSGVKIPKPRNRVSLLFEEKHQIALDLQCKNLHFPLGLPVQSMSLKPNTLCKHILKLNTVAICKEVDNSREGDSLSIDTELLEKHSSFKNESPHGNSSLIRKFLEPTHVCPPDPEQHGSVKKGTTAFSVLKSHVTPEKNKQDHIWFQETHTHESFDLKTQENVPTLVDSHSIPISEDFTDSQTFIESSTDLEEGSALEEHASEEYMFLEASPYLSQESQNILFELQKGIPLESAYMMKKIKTDLKPSYSEDSGSNNNRGCRKHSSIVTPPSYESHRTRKHRLSFKMQPPDRLCHCSLNTVEVPFVSSSVSFSEEKFSWITKNRTSYPSAPLTESNMKLHLRKTQDKPHRHPESKKRKKTKVDLFRKNVHWDRDYSYIQRKEKCTRKKQVCDCGSERAHFPSKHKSAAQPHQEGVNFHSERKQSQPFFYACIPADSLEIIPKTIRWTIPQKTLKKRNFRVPLVAKISSCYSIWSSSRKLLGSLLKSFHPVHQY